MVAASGVRKKKMMALSNLPDVREHGSEEGSAIVVLGEQILVLLEP